MKNKIGKLLFKNIFSLYITIAILLTLFQVYNEYLGYKNRLVASLATTEKIFKEALTNSIWNLDEGQINSNVHAIASLDYIIAVSILDPQDSIIAKSKKHNIEKKKLLIHTFKLNKNDEYLAKVLIYYSSDLIYRDMQNSILIIIANAIIKSFLLMFLIYYFSNKIITKPLNRLIVSINEKSINNYKKIIIEDISNNSDNEITVLLDSYNNMQDRLHDEVNKNKELSERVELALLGTNDGIWDWNIIDNTVYYSPRWKEILGYKDDELSNELSSWADRIHPDDIDATWSDIYKNVEGRTEFYENIHRLKHKDGHWVWIYDRGKTQYDENLKAVRMIGTHTDITDDKEMQLKFSQQTHIIKHVNDSVISTDLEGNIISWNEGSQKMLGYTATEVIGKSMSIFHRQEDLKQSMEYIQTVLKNGRLDVDICLVAKSKKLLYTSMTLTTIEDENNNVIGITSVFKDITARKKAEEELLKQKDILNYQANHDTLTDLPNRVLFNNLVSQAVLKAQKNKEELALLFIDLDRFKKINDSLGHLIGDKVLVEISKRLKEITRQEDTLARLGGDEFTILVQDITKIQDASAMAQKILDELKKPLYIDEHTLYVSSSVGISLYPKDTTEVNELFMYADTAMYKAKDEGRNNFQFYSSEMTKLAYEYVVMETSLRNALKNKEFVVYYQAQVDGVTSKIIGMEALVRWNHPELGLVPPTKFIPLAEETGLIVELDQWVMHTAMTQFVKWNKDGISPNTLSLNLAMKQLQQKDFMDIIKKIMDKTSCKPEYIELEITEGQIMNNPEEAIIILKNLSNMGIKLAIDDFGTGYSSLSYLKRLPIDKLKIDQSFVKDLPNNEEDIGITKAVIALAKSLNLSVIAEGVETKEQKDFLIKNGCKNIQGYFYSKPIASDEMELMLKR